MAMNNPENRRRVVAALAVLCGGEGAPALADYASDEEGAAVRRLVEAYSRGKDCGPRMQQLIRQMEASEKFSSLAEVHPAWILDRLSYEPPRVVGIILRSLPSKHVRYLLKNLPPMVVAQIPNMIESFSVAGPVLDVIRRRFERHFLPMRVSRTIERFGFENLYYLKGEDLALLIREAGLAELGIALSGMSGRTLHAVFNRLSLKDAKRLQRRMKGLKGISPELFRQARYTVLEVEGKHIGPDRMLARIGIAAIASAVEEGHEMLIRLLQQKMEPADAYLLKRSIDERRMRVCPAVARERRSLIIRIVELLSKEGRIDRLWARYFPDEEALLAAEDRGAAVVALDEETATMRQDAVADEAPQLA